MPNTDLRTRMLTAIKGRFQTSGRYNVTYRDVGRRTRSSTVLGPGTSSGLKLNVDSHVQTRIVDNVPMCTTRNQVGCYDARR
jgi:hypothetical protein